MNRLDYVKKALENILEDPVRPKKPINKYGMSFIDCLDYYKYRDENINVFIDNDVYNFQPFISYETRADLFLWNAEINIEADSITAFVDSDWYVFHTYSTEFEDRYNGGDEDAIFEFCQKFEWAFRTRWVIKQIESWKKKNTREDREKLRRLMKYYSYVKRKSISGHTINDLLRDKKIFMQVSSFYRKSKKSIHDCISDVEEKLPNIGYHRTREIYWGFRKIEELLKKVIFMYRGKLVGMRPEMRPVNQIDQIIREVFRLEEILNGLKEELKIYKDIRHEYGGIEYQSEESLCRLKGIRNKKPESDLGIIFKAIIKSNRKLLYDRIKSLGLSADALEYVRELYFDFRNLEAKCNDEDFEKVKFVEGLEVCL